MHKRPATPGRLFNRRAEAWVLDAIIAPIAIGLLFTAIASGVAHLAGKSIPIASVMQGFSGLVIAWVIVTEAAQGRSGGKGAVGIRILRVPGAKPSAPLFRACVKWLPLVMMAGLFAAAETFGVIRSDGIFVVPLKFVPIVWILLLTLNALRPRGWLDQLCGTVVTDTPDLDAGERGFEVLLPDAAPSRTDEVKP